MKHVESSIYQSSDVFFPLCSNLLSWVNFKDVIYKNLTTELSWAAVKGIARLVKQRLHMFNMASTQDTAYVHTNQMGDFYNPMHFGRVLPPNHSPHRVGVSGPP